MDQYYSTSTYSEEGLISGTPAMLAWGDLFEDYFPEILSDAVNNVLEGHVEDAHKDLNRQEEYARVAKHYDVERSEDREVAFNFGFFHPKNRALSENEQALINALEYGDAENPPRAFVRRNLFKKVDQLGREITKEINRGLGEVA